MVLLRMLTLTYMGDPYMTAPGTDYGPYSGPPMPNETIYPDHTSWGVVSHRRDAKRRADDITHVCVLV